MCLWHLLVLVQANNKQIPMNKCLTFPEPVTPSVATTASVPSSPCGPRTPSTIGTIWVQWKTSSWLASSSNTWVKANFSMALRLSVGGLRVM